MARIRPEIIIGDLYHIYNRGVDKRVVFQTERDYFRFIHALKFFNTTLPVAMRDFLTKSNITKTGVGSMFSEGGERLVDIGAFILMPTHYHLLLRPVSDNGISLYMQKLGSGYTGYFNLKRERSGALFQGRYKIKHVDKDNYTRHILAYIPLNALDYPQPHWREEGIKDVKLAKEILLSHPWSSFYSYIRENKFPGIIDPNFINEFFSGPKDYEDFVLSRSEEVADYITGVGSM